MQVTLFLIGLGLFFSLVVFPVWAIIRIHALAAAKEALARQLRQLETELRELRLKLATPPGRSPEAPPPSTPVPVSVVPLPERPAPLPASPLPRPAGLPSLSDVPPTLPAVAAEPPRVRLPESTPAPPAPVVARPPPPLLSPTRQPVAPQINWEQFMGAKLFAWLGGVAGLLAVGFFVKYSFEHNLVPPELRVAIGFLVALGLIVGGLKMDRARYAVTAQTLIATGVVSLYTVTFACRAVYGFSFFGPLPTFLLMALITGAAFLLAVRLEAQVVAILGILGGFLTPVLVRGGQDNAVGLFAYVALLNTGLVAVALHRRWSYLVPLGMVGTVAMQIAWAQEFFRPERAVTAAVACVGFAGFFLGAAGWARRRGASAPEISWSAVIMAVVVYGFGMYFIGDPAVGVRVGLVFSLVVLANLCLLVLAWWEDRAVLVALAAAGTVLLLIHWQVEICTPSRALTAMVVQLVFCAFFLAVYLVAGRTGRAAREITGSAIALPLLALGFAFWFVGQPEVGARPGLLFTYVLLADACLLAIAWFDDEVPKLHLAAGLIGFGLLALWTHLRLTAALLPWALGFYLLYAALHTAFPLLLERRRPEAAPTWWSQLFPPLAMGLMLLPLFRLEDLSLLFWPGVLLIDLLAIGLALMTASLLAVGAVLVLTLTAAGVWIFHVPVTGSATFSLVAVIGGFAVLFFAAGIFLSRRLGDRLAAAGVAPTWLGALGDPRGQIPALSALLPFLLLIMMTGRLALPDPSPVFGLALLLVGLVLGLAVILESEWLPACALVGVLGLEYAWRARHLATDRALVPLVWYLVFYAIFTAYPLVFRRRFREQTGPWLVAAVAGAGQFPLIHRLMLAAWPHPFPGVLPALFAVAPLVSLVIVRQNSPTHERVRLNQLAGYGGAALLFITLVVPVQLERQWLTLGWALEGAALLWLFHRVPHPGVRLVGVALLVTAFVRLALNPAVFAYQARSQLPILNWYLFSYGLVTACLWIGARLLAPPRDRVGGIGAPGLLNTLGTILAFLLLNIEIADYFSEPGQRVLAFRFSGHFGRDMTYTIAWALFALALLLVSIWKHLRPGRWAALALLGVALFKLFFHDLERLGALHRIGALFAVAVIAILASFAYQRFLPTDDKIPPPNP